MRAIGMIETQGLVPAIEAADAMLKAANVELVSKQKIGKGLVTIIVTGEVGSCTAAIEAGIHACQPFQALVSSHIIARPADDLEHILKSKEVILPEPLLNTPSVVPKEDKTQIVSTKEIEAVENNTSEILPEKSDVVETVLVSENTSLTTIPIEQKEVEQISSDGMSAEERNAREEELQKYTLAELKTKVRDNKSIKVSAKWLKNATKKKLIDTIIESRWNIQ